ncbi:MAG: serine protease [Actinomycetota bacterium]|nr:serine protease [Actinomycetota bacterium]
MPPPTGTDWFRTPGEAPRLTDREPFVRRYLWPPTPLVAVAVAVVVAVLVGFLGAYVYTASDSGTIEAVDPADRPLAEAERRAREEADRRAREASQPSTTTSTTRVEILSPEEIGRKVAPSVWAVKSLDEAGAPTEGSAFAAGAFGGQTFLLTSLAVVRAATRNPGPEITVRNGGSEAKATLWTWHEERDLALLVLPRSAPGLTWATESPEGKAGDKVYVATASGLTPGVIASSSPTAIQHNVFVDKARQGGPLLNERGEVLGMTSIDFNPQGAGTDRIFFAVPVRVACERVLSCGGDNTTASTVAPSGPNAAAPSATGPGTTRR